MSHKNTNLNKAKAVKNDEFYTRLLDVENEMSNYEEHFKGKVVFCNCDDPAYSAFFQYFALNFNHLGMKGLISTHYKPRETPSYALHYHGQVSPEQFLSQTMGGCLGKIHRNLKGGGDFRSRECIDLLKEADIICTNPPGSLFREFFKQVNDFKKKFIILAKLNAVYYTNVRPCIQDGTVWLGVNNGGKKFEIPNMGQLPPKTEMVNGKWFVSMGNVVWLTNLNHPRRIKEEIPLYKRYQKDAYPKYDDYDAIEVTYVRDIPRDYPGEMGVPITFLMKHNPAQFEVVGFDRDLTRGRGFALNGIKKFARVVIKHRNAVNSQKPLNFY